MYDPLYNSDDSNGPRKSRFWALRRGAPLSTERSQWPLMKLGDRAPLVRAEYIHGTERELELGYESRPHDELLFVPVFAVHPGEVVHCADDANGFTVTLRAFDGQQTTRYSHLSKVFVDNTSSPGRSEWVRAGDVIGYAAKSPIHIRFELVKRVEHELVAVDLKPELARWKVPTFHDLVPAVRKAA